MINNSQNVQALIKCKQEQLHTQIRRMEREQQFKQKRILQAAPVNCIVNPENMDDLLNSKMKQCHDIYNQSLPDKTLELSTIFDELKRLQCDGAYEQCFILAVFKNDFVRFCLLFLTEHFDQRKDLQLQAALILANFFGMMHTSSKYYFSTYIPMLNVKHKQIISCLGRYLYCKCNPLMEANLYALGNLFQDHQECIDEFKIQFGLVSLMKVSQYIDKVVWILDSLFERRQYFDEVEIKLAIDIIDDQIMQTKESSLIIDCTSCLSAMSEYLIDSLIPITQMKSFHQLTTNMLQKPEYSYYAFRTICALTRIEDVNIIQQLISTHNILELILTQLCSFKRDNKQEALWALEQLASKGEQFTYQIVESDNTIEKIITLGVSSDQQTIILSLYLLKAITQYCIVDINQRFIVKNLIPLLAQSLDYMHEKILMISLEILCQILHCIDEYNFDDQDIPGNAQLQSTTYMLGQLSINRIPEKIFQIEKYSQSITAAVDKCFELIENAQEFIDKN